MKISDASNIYVGSSQASAVYLGTTKIWRFPVISGTVTQAYMQAGFTDVTFRFNYSSNISGLQTQTVSVPIDANGYFELMTLPSNVGTIYSINSFVDAAVNNVAFNDVFSSLTIRLSMYDVEDMGNAFNTGPSCTSFDISSLSPQSLKYLYATFAFLSVASLDLSGWVLDNVEDMTYMFSGCSSLQNITWPTSFSNTSLLENISGMFQDCTSMRSVDLSELGTTSLWCMYYCFDGCTDLEVIYLPKLTTSNTIIPPNNTTGHTFRNCSSLTDVYVYNQLTLNEATNNLTSEGDNFVPATATIHYDDGITQHDYVWNGSSWA